MTLLTCFERVKKTHSVEVLLVGLIVKRLSLIFSRLISDQGKVVFGFKLKRIYVNKRNEGVQFERTHISSLS